MVSSRVLITFLVLSLSLCSLAWVDPRSPLYQNLPNCTNYPKITKVTDKKAGVCVMIKDEEGFLGEFIAFYIVQGVDHVIVYDDNSTDAGIKELAPWINRGFVTVRNNWEGYEGLNAITWGKQMKQKKMMERDCKMTLYEWGYDYHISVDLDEYEIPFKKGATLVDEIHEMFQAYPTRGTFNVNKLQFNSQPHILEPFDRLTIEAYQSRFGVPNKFNNRKGLMKKVVYWLRNPTYSNATLKFVLECCTFHSCKQGPLKFCWDLQKTEFNKVIHAPWPESRFIINHYARSLEKFTLKQRTWKQHVKSGYDISRYFERSHGWVFDNSALRYSCQVRDVYSNVTGNKPYIRPGKWIRSYEVDKNPYLYHKIKIF